MKTVKCGECKNFVPASDYKKEGDCNGFVGDKPMKNPSLNPEFKRRGGCRFMDCTLRFCDCFISK